MSNTDVQELVADEPPAVQAEIIDINTDARPIALQIALLVPLLAGLIGIGTAYRMTRLADPEPSEAAENMLAADAGTDRGAGCSRCPPESSQVGTWRDRSSADPSPSSDRQTWTTNVVREIHAARPHPERSLRM